MSEYPYIEVEHRNRSFFNFPWVACVKTGEYSFAALRVGCTRRGAIRLCRKEWARERRDGVLSVERVEL